LGEEEPQEKKKSSAAKERKTRKSDVQPTGLGEEEPDKKTKSKDKGKTGLYWIILCIRDQKKAGGSSRQAISKQLMRLLEDEHPEAPGAASLKKAAENAKALSTMLAAGVKAGKLVQNKASYRVAGDPVVVEEVVRVEIEEKKEGSGQPIQTGDEAVITYKGMLASGHKFDSGAKFHFLVGNKDVIRGMDAGVLGMCVGGRRIVHIPSALGYGKRGSSPDIPPDADLVFDITLTEIV